MTDPKLLRVEPDSELSLVLKDAATTGEEIVVDTGEARYVVGVSVGSRSDVAGTDAARPKPRPEQVARSIEGIEKAAGSWQGLIDAEAFKAYIRERRRTKNRPSVRW
jgi:hypothetical protein